MLDSDRVVETSGTASSTVTSARAPSAPCFRRWSAHGYVPMETHESWLLLPLGMLVWFVKVNGALNAYWRSAA